MIFESFDEVIEHCLLDIEEDVFGYRIRKKSFLKIYFQELEWIFLLYSGSGKHSMLYYRFEKEIRDRRLYYEDYQFYEEYYNEEKKKIRQLFEKVDSAYFINNKRPKTLSV